jgi:divinyl chlorophyllide a 8-vinyl-reductase
MSSAGMTPPAAGAPPPRRVLMLGATGTIGRATAQELVARGHAVVCAVRPRPPVATRAGRAGPDRTAEQPESGSLLRSLPGADVRQADVSRPGALARDAIRGERFDVLVSCLASRTGSPRDAWAVDHDAQLQALQSAREAGVSHVVLLSAICVQKPLLAFQHAKLAFEGALAASGLDYTIVRPTAFFKSLSGQVERVRRGKPFLVFGDGTLTACKPLSDRDLAAYLADCLDDPARRNRILPVGGPGPALTPLDQVRLLGELLGRRVRVKHVPVRLLDTIIGALELGGRLVPALAERAEFARIGRYYATESMLVLDPATGRYDADATPSTGADTLREHYARLLRGEVQDDRGAHAVF